MKLKKYIAMMLLAMAAGGTFVGCDDDDNLGEAPRLFRPVATLEAQSNSLVVTWDNIKGATEYQIDLYKVYMNDEESAFTGTPYRSITCESSPYTFEDLEWDEKYGVRISCSNEDKGSEKYQTGLVNINYISKLKSVKLIDNAARVTWEQGGSVIQAVKAVPESATDADVRADVPGTIIREVSDVEYANGSVDIVGLAPDTRYNFYAYSSVEEMSNSTYAGKMSGKTEIPEDFDATYGAGQWLDIRDYDDEMAVDTLKSSEFWEQVTDGMTIILRGDFSYKVDNSIQFDRSVRFVTAATLGGNARFVSSSALGCKKGSTVSKIEFVRVDFYSDKALGDYEVTTNTDKGFGGKQVFNENGSQSTLGLLYFKDCHIEGYRAVVRAQADSDNIDEVLLEGCTINGIGDQGVFTTNNKKADWKSVTLRDCTVSNIVMVCDFRSSANDLTLNIENCTFCYAPIETTANANTPLIRGGKTLTVNVSKTLFGPSMASEDSKGSKIKTYTAGVAGSIFVSGSNKAINVANSFKTNFAWTDLNGVTYPMDNLNELSFDENALWQGPAKGDFKVIGNVGESGIGASKWW